MSTVIAAAPAPDAPGVSAVSAMVAGSTPAVAVPVPAAVTSWAVKTTMAVSTATLTVPPVTVGVSPDRITSTAAGVTVAVHYDPAAADFDTVGYYWGEFRFLKDGKPYTAPSDAYLLVVVSESLAVG